LYNAGFSVKCNSYLVKQFYEYLEQVSTNAIKTIMNNRAALLNQKGQVIGEIFEAPEKGNTVEIALFITSDGVVINKKEYAISRSKKNLDKASYEQPISKYGDVYTFHYVPSK